MTPPGEGFRYTPGFFDYIEAGARRSAAAILPRLARDLQPRSVLDVGCGRGLWLAAWRDLGVAEVLGVDGATVAPERLAIPPESFRAADVAAPLDLGRRWDVVQCLEVAEHLPPPASDTLVDSLVRHGDRVLFSAATPGQGGHHHVNEQPLEAWRDRFARRGFAAFDAVRPHVCRDRQVEPWYRFNTLLFVHERAAGALPPAIQNHRLEPDVAVPTLAPWTWRLRCAALRPLPAGLVTVLARAKNRLRGSS